MPEYVYALHEFVPENEDEVPFRAGERIEVVEKDELYGDGWWQGRNLAGKVGLFPVSYTTSVVPSAAVPEGNDTPNTSTASRLEQQKMTLNTLSKEPESATPRPEADHDIIAPVPKAAPAKFLDGSQDFSEPRPAGDEVMKATLTDVEKAIEQLGRNHGDNDGGRSFSFASTGGDRDTDTDFDFSDVDGADNADDAEGWHKGARMKLAEKARRAVEEAEKLEAMMGGLGINSERRSAAPPIEVELSDESDDEPEHEEFTSRAGAFSGIPEEDEDVETDGGVPAARTKTEATDTPQQSTVVSSAGEGVSLPLPEKDETQLETATATRSAFPEIFSPPTPNMGLSTTQTPEARSTTSPSPTSLPRSANVKEDTKSGSPVPVPVPEPMRTVTPLRSSASPPPVASSTSTVQSPVHALVKPGATHSKHNSVASSLSLKATTLPPPVPIPEPAPSLAAHSSTTTTIVAPNSAASPPPSATSLPPTSASTKEKKQEKHPSEWTLEDVVSWLKSKGFDQDVCDKFIEQEITGDVLLELDVNLLKSEIGIMAFGKRVRISNSIAELRRPPSITYSDHTELSPMAPHTPVSPHSQIHSRTQSQSHSHHSFPGNGHAYSQSIQSSLGSPLGFPGANGYGQLSAGAGGPMQPGAVGGFVMAGGPFVESPSSQSVSGDFVNVARGGEKEGVGLGISNDGGLLKPRPTQLSSSPSDGALKDSAVADALQSKPVREGEQHEDRGHMSDGDFMPASSMRRKLFGRSHDSASSSLRHSKDMSPLASPIIKESPDGGGKDKDTGSATPRHAKGKRSVDGGRGERLSIFGGTFGGSLSGKGRKPPPSADDAHTSQPEKSSSLFSLPRLHSNTSRKSSSTHRSSTPNGSPKKSPSEYREPQDLSTKQEKMKATKEKDIKDPALLRKRTASSPSASNTAFTTTGNGSSVTASGIVKPGKSILEQIGEPDHAGWMRKKSDRYNSWKNRYFLLKGTHLYCLRNDSKSETKIKGYIHIIGYKVSVDENLDPGRYGFRIDHDHDKAHYFSSDEKVVVRDWMKAIMKATIDRDYTKPVVSSCNIPTIPLTVAQAMNPAPRPPSPTARAATQKALRRENPNQLSTRDAQVLMGISSNPDSKDGRARLDSFFANQDVRGAVNLDDDQGQDAFPTQKAPKPIAAPPRPSREMRRASSTRSSTLVGHGEDALIEWANTHLPPSLQITESSGSLCSGLALLRLAESIKGKPASPPVPDSAFPVDANDDKLDGLFKLFDFLLDNDVKMGSVSINDVRQGKRDKVLQLLKALKAWEDKKKAIAQSIGKPPVQVSGFIGPTWA